MVRYFGEFRDNKKHGKGTLYNEVMIKNEHSSEYAEIHIYKGRFNNNVLNGKVELQVLRVNELGQTIVEKLEQMYSKGSQKSSRLLSSNEISLQSLQVPVNQGLDTVIRQKLTKNASSNSDSKYHIDRLKQTCYEELDSFSKINDLVNKYPKIDTEWLPDK